MCLDRINKIYDNPTDDEFTGYKVGAKTEKGFLTEFDRQHYTYGIWHKAIVSESNNFRGIVIEGKITNSSFSYPIGFHIFSELKDAQQYLIQSKSHIMDYMKGDYYKVIIEKVRYKKVVAEGMQEDNAVVVAQEIMFTKETL